MMRFTLFCLFVAICLSSSLSEASSGRGNSPSTSSWARGTPPKGISKDKKHSGKKKKKKKRKKKHKIEPLGESTGNGSILEETKYGNDNANGERLPSATPALGQAKKTPRTAKKGRKKKHKSKSKEAKSTSDMESSGQMKNRMPFVAVPQRQDTEMRDILERARVAGGKKKGGKKRKKKHHLKGKKGPQRIGVGAMLGTTDTKMSPSRPAPKKGKKKRKKHRAKGARLAYSSTGTSGSSRESTAVRTGVAEVRINEEKNGGEKALDTVPTSSAKTTKKKKRRKKHRVKGEKSKVPFSKNEKKVRFINGQEPKHEEEKGERRLERGIVAAESRTSPKGAKKKKKRRKKKKHSASELKTAKSEPMDQRVSGVVVPSAEAVNDNSEPLDVTKEATPVSTDDAPDEKNAILEEQKVEQLTPTEIKDDVLVSSEESMFTSKEMPESTESEDDGSLEEKLSSSALTEQNVSETQLPTSEEADVSTMESPLLTSAMIGSIEGSSFSLDATKQVMETEEKQAVVSDMDHTLEASVEMAGLSLSLNKSEDEEGESSQENLISVATEVSETGLTTEDEDGDDAAKNVSSGYKIESGTELDNQEKNTEVNPADSADTSTPETESSEGGIPAKQVGVEGDMESEEETTEKTVAKLDEVSIVREDGSEKEDATVVEAIAEGHEDEAAVDAAGDGKEQKDAAVQEEDVDATGKKADSEAGDDKEDATVVEAIAEEHEDKAAVDAAERGGEQKDAAVQKEDFDANGEKADSEGEDEDRVDAAPAVCPDTALEIVEDATNKLDAETAVHVPPDKTIRTTEEASEISESTASEESSFEKEDEGRGGDGDENGSEISEQASSSVEDSVENTSMDSASVTEEKQNDKQELGGEVEAPAQGTIEEKDEANRTEFSGGCVVMTEKEEDDDSSIAVSVVTWNLAESAPLEEDAAFIRKFRKTDGSGSDIVLISGQECENTKPRRAEGHRSREFRRLMIKMLGKKYVPLAIHSLGGVQFGLFCKRDILGDVEHVSLADVPCGVGNVFHNKGGIGAFVKIKARESSRPGERAGSLRMLFVTAHLAAHVKNTEARNEDFWRIVGELEAKAPPIFLHPERSPTDENPGSYLMKSMDRIFFCGDLNYRVDLPRESAQYNIEKIWNGNDRKQREQAMLNLLRHDQLLRIMAEGSAFPDFAEGKISFPPTFKFDKGTKSYDTSHKQRIPAWTDRVLFKPFGVRVLEYNSVEEASHSDHRPVYASFHVSMLGRKLIRKKRTRTKTSKSKTRREAPMKETKSD